MYIYLHLYGSIIYPQPTYYKTPPPIPPGHPFFPLACPASDSVSERLSKLSGYFPLRRLGPTGLALFWQMKVPIWVGATKCFVSQILFKSTSLPPFPPPPPPFPISIFFASFVGSLHSLFGTSHIHCQLDPNILCCSLYALKLFAFFLLVTYLLPYTLYSRPPDPRRPNFSQPPVRPPLLQTQFFVLEYYYRHY